MVEVPPIFLAMLTGFIAGLLCSMPIGPVNLTILNESTRRGFSAGVLVGLGASSMELIYCAIAFTGFTQFLEVRMIKTLMEVFTFVFFLFLGAKFLMTKSVTDSIRLGTTAQKIEARLGEKFHPHSAYMVGFVRVLGNLNVLVVWIGLAAYLMSHQAYFTTQDFVADSLYAKVACIAGVALGVNSWFCALSFTASRGQGHLSEPAL